MSKEAYPPGSVVLVPFPFTDLSGKKKRPALVVSPTGFHEEDLVLCAITSQLPHILSQWEAPLETADMVEEKLPKRSVVKVGKLFTMHRNLIARRFGAVKEQKLQEVLDKLRVLFGHLAGTTGTGSESREAAGDLRPEEVDEAVLALLYLNAFEDHGQVRIPKDPRPGRDGPSPRTRLHRRSQKQGRIRTAHRRGRRRRQRGLSETVRRALNATPPKHRKSRRKCPATVPDNCPCALVLWKAA